LATKKQIEFVENIEAGAKYLVQEGRLPAKITAVMEAAGRTMSDFYPLVQRMTIKGDYQLLMRLKLAFESVGQAPKGIISALDQIESDVLKQSIPKEDPPEELTIEEEPLQLKLAPTMPEPQTDDTQRKLLAILQILEDSSQRQREKLITTASVYYGVGE
jgi:hypothetical protein